MRYRVKFEMLIGLGYVLRKKEFSSSSKREAEETFWGSFDYNPDYMDWETKKELESIKIVGIERIS